MLENTRIWTHGPMNLYVNNKPAKVYVNKENVQEAFQSLKNTLAKDGSIPLGIDHLPTEVIENNAILKKLNLLHVGNIHDVGYDESTNSIFIKSAELTNPLLVDLYENGELDSVSIVANSRVDDCPQDYDYVVHETNINRVDIVGKGACETCIIPKADNTSNFDSVYARLPIKKMESQNMAEENNQKQDTGLTAEEIQEVVKTAMAEALKPFDERLKKLEESAKQTEPQTNDGEGEEEDDIKAGSASEELEELEKQRKELAGHAVEVQIAAGKVLPSQKENMVKLAVNDIASFNEMMKEQPVIVDLQGRQSVNGGQEPGEPQPLTEEEKAINDVNAYFKKE